MRAADQGNACIAHQRRTLNVEAGSGSYADNALPTHQPSDARTHPELQWNVGAATHGAIPACKRPAFRMASDEKG